MAEIELGAGDVPIMLDGKEQILQPSLAACTAISRLAGGGQAAIARCQALDFDAICAVIQCGLGLNPVQAKQLPDAVYKTGTIALAGPCIDFIHIVNNGGRPPDENGEDNQDGSDPTASPSP